MPRDAKCCASNILAQYARRKRLPALAMPAWLISNRQVHMVVAPRALSTLSHAWMCEELMFCEKIFLLLNMRFTIHIPFRKVTKSHGRMDKLCCTVRKTRKLAAVLHIGDVAGAWIRLLVTSMCKRKSFCYILSHLRTLGANHAKMANERYIGNVLEDNLLL